MKKLLLLTIALSLPLAQVMRAESDKDKKKHKREAAAEAQKAAPAQQNRAIVDQRQVRRGAVQQPRTVAPAPRQAVKTEAALDTRKVERRTDAVTTERNRTVRNFDRNSSSGEEPGDRGAAYRGGGTTISSTRFVLFGGGYYIGQRYGITAPDTIRIIRATSTTSRSMATTILRLASDRNVQLSLRDQVMIAA